MKTYLHFFFIVKTINLIEKSIIFKEKFIIEFIKTQLKYCKIFFFEKLNENTEREMKSINCCFDIYIRNIDLGLNYRILRKFYINRALYCWFIFLKTIDKKDKDF